MQVKQAGRASTGAGTGTDRRQRMGQAGSLAISQYRNRVRGFNWAPLAEGGRRWPCPAAQVSSPDFILRCFMALGPVIRPHLCAQSGQCKRRRPGWTLPLKSSVGQFDSQPASVLCSSFPGQPPHPMSHPVDVALYSVLRNDLWALDKGLADLWLGSLDSTFFFLMLASDRCTHFPLVSAAGGKGLFSRQHHNNHQHHHRHQDGQQATNASIHPSVLPSCHRLDLVRHRAAYPLAFKQLK